MPKLGEKTRCILQQKNHEWRNEFLYTSSLRSSQEITILNVGEFLRSSPNPVVALVFGDSGENPKSSSTSWISCHEIPVSELWR